MSARRIWPGTPAEHEDRARVAALVRRVGRTRLRFSVYDLHRAIKEKPQFGLSAPSQLARHLHDLPHTLIRPSGRRLAAAGGNPTTGAVDAAPRLARHTWVLTERWPEYETAPPEFDDLEKTLHALWVAYLANDGQDVPTRTVTDVLRTVEALAPDREQQTSLRLQVLAERQDRLAERIPGTSDRWARWRPAGAQPVHPEFAAWVDAFRVARKASGAAGVGHATLNEVARELVLMALSASRRETWPHGRPVKIEDIRAQMRSTPRARALTQRILRSGRALHEVLGDAARVRVGGAARAQTRILKLPRRLGERCYYDVPDEPGFEHRQLYLAREDLRDCTRAAELNAIQREWMDANRLAQSGEPVLRAISAVRMLACWNEAGEIKSLVADLQQETARLPERVRVWVDTRAAVHEELVRTWGTWRAAERRAATELQPFGLEAPALLAVQRPLLKPAPLREFVPAIRHGKGSAADFFARLPALRRFPNPAHTDLHDPDPDRSSATCADQAEAIIYLAEQSGAGTLAFLRPGAALLGRSLRSPLLFRELAHTSALKDRLAGLAALALLGDSKAAQIAHEWLGDPERSAAEVKGALYTLLVLRQVEPGTWPAHVHNSRDPEVRRVARAAALAAQQRRWLG